MDEQELNILILFLASYAQSSDVDWYKVATIAIKIYFLSVGQEQAHSKPNLCIR